MRTNIVLDDELIAEAMELTGLKSKKAVVHEALRTLVRINKQKDLADLKGKIRFHDHYDYKQLREDRT